MGRGGLFPGSGLRSPDFGLPIPFFPLLPGWPFVISFLLMYAIFKNGGRQYRAEKGATLELDQQGPKEGEKLEFSEVVLVHDGQKATIGAPTVKGAKVLAEVVKNFRGEKIRVFKFRKREGYHRTRGHRSELTLVKVTDIVTG